MIVAQDFALVLGTVAMLVAVLKGNQIWERRFQQRRREVSR